jgi:hypothetical protein
MGHKPDGVVRTIKNIAEKGLFAPLPSCWEHRLETALRPIFPGRFFRVYREAPAGLETRVWRPFVDLDAPLWDGGADDAVLRLTLPFSLAPVVVSFPAEAYTDAPASDTIAPVLLAATTRAVYTLAHNATNRVQSARHTIALIDKTAPTAWRREGLYLWRVDDGGDYETLFQRFLAGGFLLPLREDAPIILPSELSRGEESALIQLLAD